MLRELIAGVQHVSAQEYLHYAFICSCSEHCSSFKVIRSELKLSTTVKNWQNLTKPKLILRYSMCLKFLNFLWCHIWVYKVLFWINLVKLYSLHDFVWQYLSCWQIMVHFFSYCKFAVQIANNSVVKQFYSDQFSKSQAYYNFLCLASLMRNKNMKK